MRLIERIYSSIDATDGAKLCLNSLKHYGNVFTHESFGSTRILELQNRLRRSQVLFELPNSQRPTSNIEPFHKHYDSRVEEKKEDGRLDFEVGRWRLNVRSSRPVRGSASPGLPFFFVLFGCFAVTSVL